jgi:Heavy metal associated domain 2
MHMLVGFVLTRLLKHARKANDILPHLRGKFEVLHSMPGRIRFLIPMLEAQDTKVIEAVKNELSGLPEIKEVDINPVTGTLVLHYNAEEIDAPIICGILLKLLGLEDVLDTQPQSIAQKELNLIGTSLNRQVYNSSAGVLDLTSTLAITIFLLGMYKIIIQKERIAPSGFSLLWWAYVIFKSGNR